MVGLFEAWQCEIAEVELAAGDTLVLYTDGITEAENADGEEFGGLVCSTLSRAILTFQQHPFSKQWLGRSSNTAAEANSRMTSHW